MCGWVGVYDEGCGVQGRSIRSQGLVIAILPLFNCFSVTALGPEFPECPSSCVKLQSFVARIGTGLWAIL